MDLSIHSALHNATANCTFGDFDHGEYFSSLSSCYSCSNITDQVVPHALDVYTLPSGISVGGLSSGIREKYRAEVRNGKYREIESKTPGENLRECPISQERRGPQVAFALVAGSSLVDGIERPCNPIPERTRYSVMLDINLNAIYNSEDGVSESDEPKWKFYPQGCVWTFDMNCWIGIKQVLGTLLGNKTSLTYGDGPLWLKAMYNHGNGTLSTVEEVVRGLTNTMSAAIRNYPSTNQYDNKEKEGKKYVILITMKYASGTAEIMQTCIYVKWGWIAYTAALLILQAIFVVIVLAGPRMTLSHY